MRICFVCNNYSGQPTATPGPHAVLARGLAAAGHEVRVIDMCAENRAADYEEETGVRVWRMCSSLRRFDWVSARNQLHRMIGRWCKNNLIDLIEFADSNGWAAGLPRFPVPVVVRMSGCKTYCDRELGRPINRTTQYFERAGLRRADFRCAASRYIAQRTDEAFGLTDPTQQILPHAVQPPQKECNRQRSGRDVLFSGTLSEQSGVLSLVYAWPQVCQQFPQARLHLFGKDGRTHDGESMRWYLKQHLEEASGSVLFHQSDSVSFVDKLYRGSVAVFPKYSDAFSLAPLEAMIRHCPTICSNLGTARELFGDGRHALLVDPKDPDQIAKAILKLLGNESFAQRIGTAGANLVRSKFTISQTLGEETSFYRSCIARFRIAATGMAGSDTDPRDTAGRDTKDKVSA